MATSTEAVRAWRARNPEKSRQQAREQYQRWYRENREYKLEQSRLAQIKRSERHRERIAAAKVDGCVDCGSREDLHFHHLDPSTKKHTVADMDGASTAAFLEEVAKCVVVCKPCHIARHKVMNSAPAT